MKRKRASILLFVFLIYAAVAAFRYFVNWYETQQVSVPSIDTVLGIHILEDSEILQNKTELQKSENAIITFGNALLPYDADTNTLYLSQSLEGGWLGRVSIDSEEPYFLCAPQDAYWYMEKEAVKEGHAFTIWALGEEGYYEFQLVISGMPIISIDTERMEEPEPIVYEEDPDAYVYGSEIQYYGTVNIFNPDVGTSKYEIIQTYVNYHHKGAVTKGLEKKSYSLKLQDYKGENVDVSLLGMRSDNSWKLNALATDVNKVREITASQLWELIDETETKVNQPGPRLEYAEVLIDGKYQGLYCLVEPIDEKKLELGNNDSLYKCISATIPSDESIQHSVNNRWNIQYPIRLRYPDVISDYASAWAPVRDYLNKFYRDEYYSYEDCLKVIDVDNIISYYLFIMATSASDNNLKNMYYAAYAQSDSSYKMMQIPWDLDYTFGNICDTQLANCAFFNEDYTVVYAENAILKLRELNQDYIDNLILEKWKEYRAGILSTKNILQMFEQNQTYIIETGAGKREEKCWSALGYEEDISQLAAYCKKRMEWLDEYFEIIQPK